jgi:hypothetical protein
MTDTVAKVESCVLGLAHLRRVLKSYADYYNNVRTHRSLNKMRRFLAPIQRTDVISSCAILGGLHHHYARVWFSVQTRMGSLVWLQSKWASSDGRCGGPGRARSRSGAPLNVTTPLDCDTGIQRRTAGRRFAGAGFCHFRSPLARDVRTFQPLDAARHPASTGGRCRLSAVTRVRSENGPPDSGQPR